MDPRFGEFCSCFWLPLLPQLAWKILATLGQLFSPALCMMSTLSKLSNEDCISTEMQFVKITFCRCYPSIVSLNVFLVVNILLNLTNPFCRWQCRFPVACKVVVGRQSAFPRPLAVFGGEIWLRFSRKCITGWTKNIGRGCVNHVEHDWVSL